VGSASAGFSLSPQRALQPFRDRSDVDIAAVSAHHFDIVWRWLRSLGAERYKLPQYVQKQRRAFPATRVAMSTFACLGNSRHLERTRRTAAKLF
jgi:hypothetical protein